MSVLTTMRDLSANDDARIDARRELHKVVDFGDVAARAAWVDRWSAALSALLAEPVDDAEPLSLKDLEEAEAAATEAEGLLQTLRVAASKFVDQIDGAMEGAPDDLLNRVEALVSSLEAAL